MQVDLMITSLRNLRVNVTHHMAASVGHKQTIISKIAELTMRIYYKIMRIGYSHECMQSVYKRDYRLFWLMGLCCDGGWW